MSQKIALDHVTRDITIKRCLILDGNVGDVFLQGARVISLEEKLNLMLKEQGYNSVITWDRVSGESCDISHMKMVEEIHVEGEDYLMDEDEAPPTSAQANTAPRTTNPLDFFSIIQKNMEEKTTPTAFILNWADYLFSTGGSFSPEDRELLTLLGKSIRSEKITTFFNEDSLQKQNMVVIITNKLSYIPLPFYQGNLEVSCIHIPKPDREERKKLLTKLEDSFYIALNKGETLLTGEKSNQYIDMLEDFSNLEMIQMAKLSCKMLESQTKCGETLFSEKLTFEKLFLLFKYGKKDNPWEKLDYQAIKNMKETLKKRVIGQDLAIERIEQVVIKAYMGLSGLHKTSSRTSPKGILFFVGPTGVGKTELCKALAHFLFGDEQACIRFDMSEYTQENSDQKLIGAPPGYVGYEEGGQLTNAIREKPFSVILFDEIEKAAKPNPRILDIFLQILEDGRLTDSKGETVNFGESIIIFTSNLGTSMVKNEGEPEKEAEHFINEVKNYFNMELQRPELLGRIGYQNIIPFRFITDENFIKQIAQSKLAPICQGVKEKFKMDLAFENQEEFLQYIQKSVDSSKGGRDIVNVMNDILLDQLAMFLFLYKQDLRDLRGSRILVSVDKNKNTLEFVFE